MTKAFGQRAPWFFHSFIEDILEGVGTRIFVAHFMW